MVPSHYIQFVVVCHDGDGKRQIMFLGHDISGKGTVDTILIPSQTDITDIYVSVNLPRRQLIPFPTK